MNIGLFAFVNVSLLYIYLFLVLSPFRSPLPLFFLPFLHLIFTTSLSLSPKPYLTEFSVSSYLFLGVAICPFLYLLRFFASFLAFSSLSACSPLAVSLSSASSLCLYSLFNSPVFLPSYNVSFFLSSLFPLSPIPLPYFLSLAFLSPPPSP